MLPDRVSNPGPRTYESGALPIALHGPAVKLLSTEDCGFRPSSTDVDRGTTSLNALKVSYFSVYLYIFWFNPFLK